MSSLLDKILSVFSTGDGKKKHQATRKAKGSSANAADARSKTTSAANSAPSDATATAKPASDAREVAEPTEVAAAIPRAPRVSSATTEEPSELDQYDYELPERLIAQSPTHDRANARMMVVDRASGKIFHRRVADIIEYLRPDDVMVLNDTKVLSARLIGKRKETNARWEGLYLQSDEGGYWEIMSKTRGKLRQGELIELTPPGGGGSRFLEICGRTADKTMIVKPIYNPGEDTLKFLDRIGWTPIPPYIRKGLMVPEDRDDYQTVYAREPGAVAAPTAGLHFTKELLRNIQKFGVDICPVTLHVGAGTFKPITVTKLSEHQMHSEWATISESTVERIRARQARGGRVVAIGTTSVRTLESASNVLPDGSIDSSGLNDATLQPFSGHTNLFIRPPYKFKTVDVMLTNFHLPKSTLVILVRAFGGDELMKRAYAEAIEQEYRFFSYGDAMLIL